MTNEDLTPQEEIVILRKKHIHYMNVLKDSYELSETDILEIQALLVYIGIRLENLRKIL